MPYCRQCRLRPRLLRLIQPLPLWIHVLVVERLLVRRAKVFGPVIVGRLRQPPGILIGLSLPHEAVLDEYLANLADAVDTVRASGAKGDADAPPTY